MSEASRRGEALIELGRAEEALAHLRRAIAEEPGDSRAHCLMAIAYFRLDRPREMLESATAARGADPQSEWPHRLRSIALRALGRDAVPDAVQAARLEPEEPLTHAEVARALQARRDFAGAEAAARYAVSLNPELVQSHAALADVLLGHGRAFEAVGAYRTALELKPDDALLLNNLAVARLRSNDRAGVSEQFEAAMRIDPRAAVARHNLLRTGPARRARVFRRFAIALLVLACVAVPDGTVFDVGFYLVPALVFEALRWFELRRLSPATRALVRDDDRARRRRWWRLGRP